MSFAREQEACTDRTSKFTYPSRTAASARLPLRLLRRANGSSAATRRRASREERATPRFFADDSTDSYVREARIEHIGTMRRAVDQARKGFPGDRRDAVAIQDELSGMRPRSFCNSSLRASEQTTARPATLKPIANMERPESSEARLLHESLETPGRAHDGDWSIRPSTQRATSARKASRSHKPRVAAA